MLSKIEKTGKSEANGAEVRVADLGFAGVFRVEEDTAKVQQALAQVCEWTFQVEEGATKV
jgi:hypothetical protein